MNNTEYKARMVRAKTREVLAYHRDDEQPGKPLHLLIPGGLIALASLGLIVLIGYLVWIDGSMAQEQGLPLLYVLIPFYVGGVFLFSYGYELYNLPRAIRLTAIIVFVTVAAVVIVAVLAVLAGSVKGGGSQSSSSSGKSSSGSGSGGQVTGASHVAAATSHTGTSGGLAGVAEVAGRAVGGAVSSVGSGSTTHVVTREVIREVPVAAAAALPLTLACPFCNRSYVPADSNYICPSCGASTPPDLIPK